MDQRMVIMKRLWLLGLPGVLVLASLFAGCVSSSPSPGERFAAEQPAVLRIGVAPDFPPIIFKKANELAGVEADLARALAVRMGRTPQFVELAWPELIPALLDGKIDIIMSGLSITDARKVRIAFSRPYFKTGLMALVQQGQAEKFKDSKTIMDFTGIIGIQEGTTAEVFLNQNCPRAKKVRFSIPADGAQAVEQKTIDLFIHDSPTIVWLSSEHEATLTTVNLPFTEDFIAWGMRKTDQRFQETVNAALKEWTEDGTLDRILNRWLAK